MSAQTESNQVQIVPVSASVVEQPHQEVAQELPDVRDTVDSSIVAGVGQTTPVDNDHVTVLNGEEGVTGVSVDSRVAVAVPTVDDNLRGAVRSVVGVPNRVDVAVHQYLVVVAVIPVQVKL